MNTCKLATLILAAACIAGCEEDETDYDAAYEQAQSANQARQAEGEAQQAPPQQDRKRWDAPPAMQIDTDKAYTATIKTNMGEIKVALLDDAAPKTVNNFVFLARNDFYDGTIFHRVIDDFMIQGGDPTGTGMGDPGYKFADEFDGNPHKHDPFMLSMANAGPNTNGSQFFITETAQHGLDGKHTVFGQVIEGKEVVTKIAAVPTSGPPRDRPRQDVVIEDIVIEESGAAADPATQPAE